MKSIATGLLVLAAVVYVAASALEARHPWLFYVAAAAEAAMIGALADWFAVVALFRHPLNLRFIPHTAILPRNKARIARGLSDFIQQNFLSADAVVARIAAFQPATTLCAWLVRRENAGVLAGYAARLLAYALDALDDARVRRFLHDTASATLRKADFSAAGAQVLDLLTERGRHHALLDAALVALDEVLSREETKRYLAEEVSRNAPFLLKSLNDLLNLKLDEKAALKIVEVAIRKISEIRQDRSHELRQRFDAYVARFIARLKEDEALRARVQATVSELVDSPALAAYIGGLWQQLRDWLAADVRSDSSVTRERLAQMVMALGAKLESDPGIRQWIDEQILRALPPLVEEHRAKIGRFVEEQVNGWQEKRLVDELERHIGPDLQYIRVNGTIVGAMAGLAIAAGTQLVRGY
jgi:uncharacterized membrane-anchored protein YjiN (DUF445 family)